MCIIYIHMHLVPPPPPPPPPSFPAAKEKQLGTNTMLLMSLRFVFLSSLSVHVIAGVWYSLACYNKVMATLSTGVCKSDSWARHPGEGVTGCGV